MTLRTRLLCSLAAMALNAAVIHAQQTANVEIVTTTGPAG